MKIEFLNSIVRLSFLCHITDIKIAWINPCILMINLKHHNNLFQENFNNKKWTPANILDMIKHLRAVFGKKCFIFWKCCASPFYKKSYNLLFDNFFFFFHFLPWIWLFSISNYVKLWLLLHFIWSFLKMSHNYSFFVLKNLLWKLFLLLII